MNKSIIFLNDASWKTKKLNTDGGQHHANNGFFSYSSLMNLIYYLMPHLKFGIIFDMKTNDWTSKSPILLNKTSSIYQSDCDACQIVKDKYIYYIGGKQINGNNGFYTNQLLRFDTENDTITILANMTTKRHFMSCVLYNDEYIYVMAGEGISGYLNIIEVYNITSDTWSDYGQRMKNKRIYGFSVLHPNNKWIVTIGGNCYDNGVTLPCPTEYLDIDTGINVQDNGMMYDAVWFCNVVWRYSDNITIMFLYGGEIDYYHTIYDVSYMVLSIDDYVEGLTPSPTMGPIIKNNEFFLPLLALVCGGVGCLFIVVCSGICIFWCKRRRRRGSVALINENANIEDEDESQMIGK